MTPRQHRDERRKHVLGKFRAAVGKVITMTDVRVTPANLCPPPPPSAPYTRPCVGCAVLCVLC